MDILMRMKMFYIRVHRNGKSQVTPRPLQQSQLLTVVFGFTETVVALSI